MSLYPTKTRLALLQAVADGAVQRTSNPPDPMDEWEDITRRPRWVTVTARVAEQEREGWIRLGSRDDRWNANRLWEITPAGQAILDGNGGPVAAVTP